jgi:cell division septal protein FtsQ
MGKYKYRRPHQFKRKKSFLINRFFWLSILSILVIGGIFYFLFLSNFFQVKEIRVEGEKEVSEEKILLVFPLKNIFLINLGEIKNDILDKFPQIGEVEIKRKFPDVLEVVVSERTAVANWCGKQQCFLLDNNGIVFKEKISENNFSEIGSVQNSEFSLGEKMVGEEDLSKILNISSYLKSNLELPLEKFVIFSEDKLAAKISEGWEIYFNLQKDIDWQLTKLRAVLEEKIPSENRKDLEYIELRFGNFAPYKYKD